ncbi:MAG TPA: ABC transporter permease [Desulfobacteraceae bacterium]|nr:ABC transporter permease [Desulfobacteraceae bacterium]
MKTKVPICPACKKELPEDAEQCAYCAADVTTPKYREIFSWKLSDRFFLFSVILLFMTFFLPWFPGRFLYQDQPFSAFHMLLSLYDLDIEFLASYNILRMSQMVPLFAIVIFFLIYLADHLKTTPYPGIFMFVMFFIGTIPFFFNHFSLAGAWALTAALLVVIFSYYKSGIKKGTIGRTSYYMFFVLFLVSLFIYLFHLSQGFYAKLETFTINDTYGFFSAWIIVTAMVIVAFFRYMVSIEDFWCLLGVFVFSLVAYGSIVEPFFVSGPLRFFADNFSKTGLQTVDHLKIVGIALAIAIVAGIPLGVYITRHPVGAKIILYISSILITIPSIAMFGFMMPILSSIDKSVDMVQGIGIGTVPAVTALALYSLLPIIRNTYIALKNVDPSMIEAGIGMGMTSFQLLIRVELPLSAPIIMAGVRTSVVMGVAIAALAAYIGAGGLGDFIVQGLQRSTNAAVLAGAISMGLLAIVCDIFLEKCEDWVTPTGLKVKQATD